MNTFEKERRSQDSEFTGRLSILKNRAGRILDGIHQNLILIFAGAMVSVIAGVALAWIALQAKHEEFGHLIARNF